MMKTTVRASLVAAVLAFAFVGPAASADQPGAHPAYLHALTDLRVARANLEKKQPLDRQAKWDEGRAVGAIDRAISDIKGASIDDGKNLDDHPPVDTTLPRAGRLHRALDALQAAHDDIDQHESDAFAQGLKHRALGDVNDAILRTKEGLCNEGDRAFCPR